MARNKYPEETVTRILDVATRLFMERGYDNTSMQDIVDNLGGLTKGAIYHHFKSKEEIFEAAMERLMAPSIRRLEEIRDDRALTGLQKVQRLYDEPANGAQTELFLQSAPSCDPMKNPRLLAIEFRDCLAVSARQFLLPVIEEGVRDGSIATEYPQELAEALSLLGNLWAMPLFHPAASDEELARRSEFLELLARRMGLDVRFGNAAKQVGELARQTGE